MAGSRVSQVPLEVLAKPDTVKARPSQAVAEVLAKPDTAAARATQVVLEVIYPSSNPTGGAGRAWGYILG